MSSLLTLEEALGLISARVQPLRRKSRLPIDQCTGLALAEALISREPLPRFDNSAVDGYAIAHPDDLQEGAILEVDRQIYAGQEPGGFLTRGRAARVMTGAPTPQGTIAVVMQEDVEPGGAFITLRETCREGEHLRKKGADFGSGEWLADVGSVIDPGLTALLVSQGVADVECYEPPKVAIVTIGDELVVSTRLPEEFQIRDTNGPMLSAMLKEAGCRNVSGQLMRDEPKVLQSWLGDLAGSSDLVVVCGGASVGDKDHTAEAVRLLGEVVFHGVKVRPGKPTLFGVVRGTPVFGLPGNPASAFVCFELFVRPAIDRLAGRDSSAAWVETTYWGSGGSPDRDDFIRARFENGVSVSAENQKSYGLRALAGADCLVRIPAGERGEDDKPRKALLLRRR